MEQDEPFERKVVSMEEAREIFADGFHDKLEILEYRPEETMRLYTVSWMTDSSTATWFQVQAILRLLNSCFTCGT